MAGDTEAREFAQKMVATVRVLAEAAADKMLAEVTEVARKQGAEISAVVLNMARQVYIDAYVEGWVEALRYEHGARQ